MNGWAIFGLAAILLLAGYLVYRAGKKRERGKIAESNIEAVKDAQNVENKVAGMSDAAVHDELSKWRR